MAWKKLTFDDEVMLLDGTNPMAGDLDMGDYQINGVDDIKAYDVYGVMVRNSAGVNMLQIAESTGLSFLAYGDADMGAHNIVNVADPSSANHAATKNYVDTHGGVTDHGALTGLADDDHTQYVLASGTRAMAGDLNFAKHNADAMCIQPLASAPSTPGTAQMYYNTTDDHLYCNVV